MSLGTHYFNEHFFLSTADKLRIIYNGKAQAEQTKDPPKFNMKSHGTISNLASKYSWVAKLDLKNAFFSIPIADYNKRHFGLKVRNLDGRNQFYRYNRMPFDNTHSAFYTHLVIDEAVKRLRELGLEVSHYMDDITIWGHSQPSATLTFSRQFDSFGMRTSD